jgi:hypothetical protein
MNLECSTDQAKSTEGAVRRSAAPFLSEYVDENTTLPAYRSHPSPVFFFPYSSVGLSRSTRFAGNTAARYVRCPLYIVTFKGDATLAGCRLLLHIANLSRAKPIRDNIRVCLYVYPLCQGERFNLIIIFCFTSHNTQNNQAAAFVAE